MNKYLSFSIVVIFILVVFGIYIHLTPWPLSIDTQSRGVEERLGNFKVVKIAGQSLKLELAETPTEQERGLSGRAELKEAEGLLFVFEKPARHSFWMKEMNFAIDIIWVSEEMKVIYIKKNATPESYPETYTPDQAAKYVLEVVSGFSDQNNLKVGDTVEFGY